MRTRKGLGSIVSWVALIAVTLVVGSAFVAWMLSMNKTVQDEFALQPLVEVMGGSVNSTPVLVLHIENSGQRADTILKVEIKAGRGYYVNATRIKIPAGWEGDLVIRSWTRVSNPDDLVSGDWVRVYVYTEEHGVLFQDLVVCDVG